MRISKMILMAGAVIALASCGDNSEALENVEVEMKTLSVDAANSSLAWKGMKNAEYFHTGTVSFKDGSAEFIDGALVSGTFSVDMKTIAVTDATPDDQKAKLVGHLGMPDFFDVAKNQTVTATCGAYMDGKLPITLTISGVEIKKDVPVTVTYKDGKGSITGKFDVDFSALNAVGFQPAKGEEEFVQPVVNFDLNMSLK